ncbi:hypothetical protein KM043_012587 [Ampulex compressa]|nr:hypothetical protein KM043_012587 [Ampulex compressa]
MKLGLIRGLNDLSQWLISKQWRIKRIVYEEELKNVKRLQDEPLIEDVSPVGTEEWPIDQRVKECGPMIEHDPVSPGSEIAEPLSHSPYALESTSRRKKEGLPHSRSVRSCHCANVTLIFLLGPNSYLPAVKNYAASPLTVIGCQPRKGRASVVSENDRCYAFRPPSTTRSEHSLEYSPEMPAPESNPKIWFLSGLYELLQTEGKPGLLSSLALKPLGAKPLTDIILEL